ncbi:2-acylglycerol O-acyltransferase 1 [Orycteropus afer afer]|uniref:2-acylglycerol O-acyltransferase 1 n=1 Tax=Orycteropus afer afer TaxID=1230840 RepID=A0A8B6ZDQ7_ORYAF|nr:2-acylglycerol O-acyltransferase 1 [Orycteropus afer afer]
MKIEFAPLNIPLERRLQTAAVLKWVLSFLLLAQVLTAILVILIIYNYWLLYVPYLTWLYFDWHTPEQGGRRSQWVRSWTIWRYFKDYFPIHLIKTWDLDPSHNYIFGYHPHGILVAGAFGNFCTNYSDFEELFPGFTAYLHVLPFWFRCPFFREYLMSSGPVSVSKKSVSYVLSKEGGGNISVIVLGGAEEALDAHPGKFTLFIRQRKGFVKMALTHGCTGGRMLVMWTPSYVHIPHSCVGRPIPVQQTLYPTPEQIEELHQTYMEELRKLFEEHKGKYGIPEHKTLRFK